MDAVPGIPTTLWFTPLYTTAQMKEKTGNENFTYEISCDQICGKGHFSMRGVIVVDTEADYKKWLSEQVPQYYSVFPDKKPKTAQPDTAKAANNVVALKTPLATVISAVK
jgi:cytochrome c oxidase subunit 2